MCCVHLWKLGVLIPKGRELYQKAQKVQILNKEILPLIVEATIRTNDKKIMPVKEIVQNFALFPFQLDRLAYEIIDNDRISMLGTVWIKRSIF